MFFEELLFLLIIYKMVKRSYSMSRRTPSKRARTTVLTTRTAEKKEYMQTFITTIGANSFGVFSLASSLSIGAQGNQRLGNKIRIKSIEVSGQTGSGLALPLTATLFNAKSVAAFTAVDFNGPYVYEDSGTNYSHKICNDSSGTTFKFKKTFPGVGKEQTYDKDTGAVTHHAPTLLITNPNAAATTNTAVWCKVEFYDY